MVGVYRALSICRRFSLWSSYSEDYRGSSKLVGEHSSERGCQRSECTRRWEVHASITWPGTSRRIRRLRCRSGTPWSNAIRECKLEKTITFGSKTAMGKSPRQVQHDVGNKICRRELGSLCGVLLAGSSAEKTSCGPHLETRGPGSMGICGASKYPGRRTRAGQNLRETIRLGCFGDHGGPLGPPAIHGVRV